MKNISASLTKEQIYESAQRVAIGQSPIKDVTRRLGWLKLKAGERLQFVEKGQGLKKGEHPVKICVVEVVSVRREKLNRLTKKGDYGSDEVLREGFPQWTYWKKDGNPKRFVEFFCKTHKGCTPQTKVTRIEFKYIV